MADKRTIVYEIKIEEGQAIQAFEALNLKQQENKDSLKAINAELKENKAATATIVAEIDTQNGATAEQNAALETLRLKREELNRQQAEAIIIGKDLTAQAGALIKEILDLSKANQDLGNSQDQQAAATARQADAMLAAEQRAKLLGEQARTLFDNFNNGDVSETAFQNINSALIDTRAELTKNKAAIAENGKAEDALTADIRKSGVATEEQLAQVTKLTTERAELKALNTSLVTTEGTLSAIYRETKNDVTGLTEAELRFRDKMAQATTDAIKKSGALAELTNIAARFSAQEEAAAQKLAKNEITQRQYNTTQSKTLENIQKITAQSQTYSARLDELNVKLKAGDITEEQFKTGVKELTKEVEAFGKEVVKVADTSIEALRTQLREAKADAQRAFLEFGRGSEEFQRAAARVDDLDDSIKEVNISVQAIDLEGKVEVIGRIAQGISGGFQVATGAMALFGTESEEVQEALLKVQAAIAIGQGVNQLVEGTKAMRGFAIAIGLTTGAQEANAVATGAATVATGAQTTATGAATVATRVLGATMNALPILAVIAAIGGLVAIVSSYGDETDEAKRSYQSFLDTINNRAERSALDSELDKAKLLADLELERQQRVREFEAGTRKQVEQTAEEQQRDAERLAEVEKKSIEAERIAIAERKKAFEELQALKQGAVGDQNLSEVNTFDVINDQKLSDLRIALELEESATKQEIIQAYYAKKQEFREADLKGQAAIIGRETDIAKTSTDILAQIAADAAKKRDEEAKEAERKAKERADRIKKVEETIQQDLAALRDRTVASTTGTADDDAAELDRIREKYATQIADAEGFADRIITIEGIRDAELLLAQNEQQRKRLESLDAFKAKEAEAIFSSEDRAVKAEEAKWDAVIAATRAQAEAAGEARESVDAQIAAQEARRDEVLLAQRLARIDAANEAERQKILEKYRDLNEQAARLNADEIAAINAKYQARIDAAGNSLDRVAELEAEKQTEIDQLQDQAGQREIQREGALGTELLSLHTETEAQKTQITADANASRNASNQAAHEAELARMQADAQAAVQLFSALQAFSDANFDSRIRDVTEQTAALQEQMNATTDEVEKERIKSRIDGLNKEKKALEESKKNNQVFATAAALISTYLSAQQAYASQLIPGDPSSFPRAIAAAIAATIAGLLNVAKIQGFDKSGKVRGESGILTSNDGRPIRRDNGDNLLVTAQVGEMFVNEAHQRKAQLLYGDDVWKKIGIPGFASSGVVVNEWSAQDIRRLSGYAGSGVVNDLFIPQPAPQVITQVIQAGAQQALAERPIIVDVREVTDSQARVASVNELARA